MKQTGQKGFALIITLVITALLVAVVTEFIREVYVDTTLRRNWLNAQQASLLADSGITAGLSNLQALRLKQEATNEPLSLSDLHPLSLPAPEGSVEVTFEDEDGKLNLNSIGLNDVFKPIGQQFLRNFGLPAEPLLNALADWIDVNEDTNINGAEKGYYLGLTPAYKCRNRKLETVEELRLVKGFSSDVMEKLLPFITVYSGTPGGTININTAAEPVILALHPEMTKEMVKRIIENRPYRTPSEVGTKAAVDLNRYSPSGAVWITGSIYRIRAKATVGEAVRTVETVVDMKTQKKLYWREY